MKVTKPVKVAIFIIIDICIVCVSAAMQMILRFGFFESINNEYFTIVEQCLPVDVIIAIFVIMLFKLYNRVWTFASIDVLEDVFFASLTIEAAYMSYRFFFNINMPRSFYIFNWMCMFLLLCLSRISVRIVRRLSIKRKIDDNTKHIMVVGAGQAGVSLIQEYKYGRENKKVVCAIDRNPNKINQMISDVKVVGDIKTIPKMAKKYDIDEIIIAIPTASPDSIREIISYAEQTDAKILRMPSIAESLGTSGVDSIREINYEDLLQRRPVKIYNPELGENIKGKTIMVTGAAGSIGSELCRQILANQPGMLVLVDIYENTTYTFELELRKTFPRQRYEIRIASVRDYDGIENLMKEFRPNIIYHAAAHKHVPLMEDSPNEAIKNNCLGTLNMVKLAHKYKVEKFVLISTDKAVNPTSVMGASKRICEMIIQTYNKKSSTEFVAVRFGNVLGSNGSVVPIFLKQIEQGGPITLTHRDITRFFMTIPEAVSLVLSAGLMAKGGEIFVLDMGHSVKIYDLACNLIKMKGLVPNEDIRIEITGLRPGEKLYEEILMDEEGLKETDNKLIHIGKPIKMNEKVFLKNLNSLIEKAEENIVTKEDIKEIVTTYNYDI